MSSRKRKASPSKTGAKSEKKIEKDEEEEVKEEEKPKKAEKDSKKSPEKKSKKAEESVKSEGKKEMKAALKILCWNVNGLRAWLKKGSTLRYVKEADADIICFQEVKCTKDEIPDELVKALPGYEVHWLTGEKPGYAGVGMLTRLKPVKVTFGLGNAEHDEEGRVISAEFDKFHLVNAYVPNSGRGLPRLGYRTTKWDPTIRDHLVKLDATKPVIMCGDLNVAHKEIDLTNPKTNLKTAGFTPAERTEFDKLLKLGFVDSFRHFYPDKKDVFSFWSARGNSRASNVGWRLDYFVVSQRFTANLVDSIIAGPQVIGSDHCPLILLANA